MACQHCVWLTACENSDVVFWDCGRLPRLLKELANPIRQRPSVQLFIGRKTKDIALRELFPWNNLKNKRQDGLATLRTDNATSQSDFPVLFAESDPSRASAADDGIAAVCHETTCIPAQWHLSPDQDIFDIVHARLLNLFADLICFFVDDFPTFEEVVSRLRSWASIGRPTAQFPRIRPRVVLVKNGAGPGPSSTYDLLESEYFRTHLSHSDLVKSFSTITMLHLADEQISPLSRFRRLKELVQRFAEEARHARETTGCLYNAQHLSCFFELGVKHTARSITTPFNFVRASRAMNPIDSDFAGHLQRFLTIRASFSLREKTTHIASCILMDAYPPGMHLFDPVDVYDCLYAPLCQKALEVVLKRQVLARHQCQVIGEKLLDHFVTLQVSQQTAAQVHRSNLENCKIPWSSIYSNSTCLSCLRRRPETAFTCGHSLCDVCIRIHGSIVTDAEHTYEVPTCIYCGSDGLEKRLKPPTAGVRILSIDGGGIRGVIPLELLRILQASVGDECPIQDLFDLAFGTSSGGLIILGLFLRRWSVEYSAAAFDKLTRELFGAQDHDAGSLFHQTRRLLRCWLSDGLYNHQHLETVLQRHLGSDQRMFGSASSFARVAVTATTIGDASSVVIPNYNGQRPTDSGYTLLRPADVRNEPYIWEAARATSAAPVLFQPTKLSSLGTFQDGGLKHNNPVNLALWETRHIWPAVGQPDVVISLGTGTDLEETPAASSMMNFRHVLYDGFVPRLWRSFMSSLDGQSTWRDLWNRLDDSARDRYFRGNIHLSGTTVPIDDVGRMEELRACARASPHNERFRSSAAFALLAAAFFFELNNLPLYQNGKLYCRGSIRCRLQGPVVCRAMSKAHPDGLSFMTDAEVLGYFNGLDDICVGCHCYHKDVEFALRHADDTWNIFLQGPAFGRRAISGFPQTIRWFQDQQYLAAHFGSPLHVSMQEHCSYRHGGSHERSLLPKRKGGEHYSSDCPPDKRRKL